MGTDVGVTTGMEVGVSGTGVGSGTGRSVGLSGTSVSDCTVGVFVGLLLDEASVGGADGAPEAVTSVIFLAFTDRNESPSSNFDAMLLPFSNSSNIMSSRSAEIMSSSKKKENFTRTT
jgi:hypothetical protein